MRIGAWLWFQLYLELNCDQGIRGEMPSSNSYHRNEYDRPLEMEGMVDNARPPQLDKVICRCRCGCACSSSRDNSNGNSERDGCLVSSAGCNTISDDVESVDGQEGVEYDITAVDHRMAWVRNWRAQIRQPDDDDHIWTGYYSMEASGLLPSESMIIESSNSETIQSSPSPTPLTDSTHSMSPGDPLSEMGAHLVADDAHPLPANYFHAEPLWLTHELAFVRNMDLGGQFFMHIYPTDISMGGSASSGL